MNYTQALAQAEQRAADEQEETFLIVSDSTAPHLELSFYVTSQTTYKIIGGGSIIEEVRYSDTLAPADNEFTRAIDRVITPVPGGIDEIQDSFVPVPAPSIDLPLFTGKPETASESTFKPQPVQVGVLPGLEDVYKPTRLPNKKR